MGLRFTVWVELAKMCRFWVLFVGWRENKNGRRTAILNPATYFFCEFLGIVVLHIYATY